MSPSLPTPAFLYILNIFLSPTLPKFPFFHNCHAIPKGHGLPPPQNSERALGVLIEALLGGPSASTPTSGGTSSSDKKGGAREWIKDKLKALSQL